LRSNYIGHLFIALIVIFFLTNVNGAISWFASVDGWEIYRESGTVGFDMEGHVTGKISSINVTPDGRSIGGYHSRYANAGLNDVRIEDRTGAYEGSFEYSESLYLRSSAKEEVKREVIKPRGEAKYIFNYYELWPVIIGSVREVRYAGTGINDREFAGNNLDYIGSGFLYNTELSKINIRDLKLERMNMTVIASDDGVERVIFQPTKNTSVFIDAEATGVTRLKYRQVASDQKTIFSEGDEHISGTNRQRTVIQMSTVHKRD